MTDPGHSEATARHRLAAPEMTLAERLARLGLLLVLLYLFLLGVDVLGGGIAGLGGDVTDALFRGVAHPIGGLSVGVLATVLVQSSSVTTSTIVALVGTGVVGLDDAVPMIMGANIGTTVTNTLASLGVIRRLEEFRRAFAGATMHDFFNVLSVIALLPLELATGFLSRAAIALSDLVGDARGGEFQSPFKEAVGFAADGLEGAAEALTGGGRAAAIALIVAGLALIFATLTSITKTMRTVIAGAAERSLNRVLGRSGAVGILVGVAITVAVQSSSISTSLLIPMIAAGVLTLENGYPLTLGANLGTTVTALIAALAVPEIEGLQIALVHLLFNLAGTLLFYPVPALRRIPLAAARWTADQAVKRRALVLAYIVALFLLAPLAGALVFR